MKKYQSKLSYQTEPERNGIKATLDEITSLFEMAGKPDGFEYAEDGEDKLFIFRIIEE